MTTIYQKLAPLGFAEWLEKNFETLMSLDEWFKDADKEEINSSERTVMNALAFRWLREEKGINISINLFKDHAADNNDPYEYRYLIFKGRYTYYKDNTTHPLAEHEALNKALELLSCSPDKQGEQSKGGDDE